MEAVIFIGIQGSGKSSFYQARFANTHIRLNLDMLRTRHREAILLRACLEAKQPFVIDNTNPTSAERKRYIELARIHHFRVVGYYFQSLAADALARNANRTGRARVPDKAILGTAKRLELPQRQGEGFDALYYVRFGATGDFQVEEWSE